MEVTEFVKNKKMVARTIGASKFKATLLITLEPTAKGAKLTYSMDYELPYSVLGKLVDKLKVGKEMEKNLGVANENIKKALEA
jgi:carbon monoxide dehydrogenase subunit G